MKEFGISFPLLQPFNPGLLLLVYLFLPFSSIQLGEKILLLFFNLHIPRNIHPFMLEEVNILNDPLVIFKDISKVFLTPCVNPSF